MNKFIFLFTCVLFILISSDWINENIIYIFPTGIRHIILFLTFFITFLFSKNINISLSKRNLYFFLSLILIILISFNSEPPFLSFILSFFSFFLFIVIFYLGQGIKVSMLRFNQLLISFIILILLLSIVPLSQALLNRKILRFNFGFFREVGAFGSFMNIACVFCLYLYKQTKRNFFLYLSIYFSGIIIYTILKKVIISNIFVWVIYLLTNGNSTKLIKTFYLGLVFIFVVLLLNNSSINDNITQNIDYFNDNGAEGHVRIAMYLASFKIAIKNFPFGSGLGTFGSLGSIFGHYSPLYYTYGVNTIGSNDVSSVINGHHTLLDTFWPHIVAELGIIGTFLYTYLYIFPILYLRKYRNNFTKGYKNLYFLIFCLIMCSIWEGFTLYTPEIPVFIFINFGITSIGIAAFKKTSIII